MSRKIVALDIQNVMRIRAVNITPDKNVVVLGGRNAQGKTSVLDAISMAIGGMNLCPDMPIREGEETARIALTLGDMEVVRQFSRREGGEIKSTLTVKNAKGQPLNPPQKILNELVGRLAFDPLEFARMSPKDRRETLRALVGLDVEQLEEDLGNIFRQRTEAGVAKRSAQAVVDDMPIPGDVPQRVSTDAITAEMSAANERVKEYEAMRATCERHRAEELRLHNAISEIEANLARLKAALVSEEQLTAEASDALEGFVVPDFDEIKDRLDSAMRLNEDADAIGRTREQYDAKDKEAILAAGAWKVLDEEHTRLTFEIKKRTEAVEYPIEALDLRKEGVYYQGVPFEQGSRAERIKVSMAMGCAMNKELGILLIRDGSVLDEGSMEMLASLAAEKDMQFWIEMARGYEGEAGAIVIEDGGVV